MLSYDIILYVHIRLIIYHINISTTPTTTFTTTTTTTATTTTTTANNDTNTDNAHHTLIFRPSEFWLVTEATVVGEPGEPAGPEK